MTTMTYAAPSRPEIDLLMAAAVRATEAAVPPAQRAGQRVTGLAVGWLGSIAAGIAAYDVTLLARAVGG